MTREELAKVIPFMHAYINGEHVQYDMSREMGHAEPVWSDIPINCMWLPTFTYRIKPKAREIWLVWDNKYTWPMIFTEELSAEARCKANKKYNSRIQHIIEEV